MRIALTSLVSGTLFGAGLALGGMTDPARVRGFLDIFGDWDPTLAFVMGGAVIVMAIAWRIVPRMAEPVVAGQFHLPTKSDLTPRLIGGAGLFGIGRGIAGPCPGPGNAAVFLVDLESDGVGKRGVGWLALGGGRFFCKQKTAYGLRISDWSSDVCSSDLLGSHPRFRHGRRRHCHGDRVAHRAPHGRTGRRWTISSADQIRSHPPPYRRGGPVRYRLGDCRALPRAGHRCACH